MRLIAYCDKCGWENRAYTVRGQAPVRCPECGHEIEIEEIMQSDINGNAKPHREGEHDRH